MDAVSIQMLGDFSIAVNETVHDNLISKSRKGVSLLTYLILQDGKLISSQRLIREMWSSKKSCNPANALKTMISRLRVMLNEVSPGLGECIQCAQGGYSWKSGPNVRVDALEFNRLLEELKKELPEEQRREKYQRILELYKGDLVQTGELINGVIQSSWMHREYLEAMYDYVKLLRAAGEFDTIHRVCEQGLRVDELDEFFRIERIYALSMLEKTADPAREEPNETIPDPGQPPEETYQHMATAGVTLQLNLAEIRQELQDQEKGQNGPFFCEYEAFKVIYNIQMRNLERLGSTMFLGVIMVGSQRGELSDILRESAMAALHEVLRRNLRRGDIVTRFAPNIIAMLLPTVNYSTGGMVIDRVESLFYSEYPNPTVVLHHLIAPLGGHPSAQDRKN